VRFDPDVDPNEDELRYNGMARTLFYQVAPVYFHIFYFAML